MWEIMFYEQGDGNIPSKTVHDTISEAMSGVEEYYEGYPEPFWRDDEMLYIADDDRILAQIVQIDIEPLQRELFEIDGEEFPVGRFGKFNDEELWLFINLLGTTVAKANVHTRKLLQEVIYEQKMRFKNTPEE